MLVGYDLVVCHGDKALPRVDPGHTPYIFVEDLSQSAPSSQLDYWTEGGAGLT